MNKELIQNALENPLIPLVVDSADFYFQKGQDSLKRWLELQVSTELSAKLIDLSSDYEKIQSEAEKDKELQKVLDLLFEIISYCDTKAKNKNIYNKYPDKRCLAMAFVRMNNWVEHLILFKLAPNELPEGSPNNAFKYFLGLEDI